TTPTSRTPTARRSPACTSRARWRAWPGWIRVLFRSPSRELAGRADQGPAARARPAAAAARREGRAHTEHGLADRVGPAHALAQHARQDRRRARRADRHALRRPAGRPHPGHAQEGLPGGVLRRLVGEVEHPGRRPLRGQDSRGRVHAGPAGQGRQDGEGPDQAGPDEALLRAGRIGRTALQRRAAEPRGGRQRPAGRRPASRLGEPRHPEGPRPLGDPRLGANMVIDFRTEPSRYKHWKLAVDGRVATLSMDVSEDGGLVPGYELKLNSYDLGVDIELYDAVQRLRFEHPEVGAVILTSAKERVFCAGANIRMLNQSSHGWKVNFCKFTNETRNGIEEASAESRQAWICAVNGPCAGGGYELALACEHIVMADDSSTTVSLPEVPLLAVLPGTGGLTRLVDKRHVRRDRADFFCTTEEGLKGKRAVEWNLVDEIVPRSVLDEAVKRRAADLAARSDRPESARGIALSPLERRIEGNEIVYSHVACRVDRGQGIAEITVSAPGTPAPTDLAAIHAAGAGFWPLVLARELDDLILHLRANEEEIGLWVFKTSGSAD